MRDLCSGPVPEAGLGKWPNETANLTLWLAFAGVMVKVKLYGGVSRRLDESVMSTVAVAFGLSARTVIFGKDTEMGFAALGLS